MEPTFEEAFDFDLNFIQQPVQNVMSNSKIRKAILIAKKKTIATDSLIKKYLAKKEILRQSELMLNSAKEECKQVCIDYKDTLEKCTSLERDLQTLDQKYKILESNYVMSQNQCEAIKSHANQLQSLIKENELKIESLQIENKLVDKKNAKESKGKDKLLIKENEHKKESKGNHDKTYSLLKKENEKLFKHIILFKDIIMGKTKLQKEHRMILNKYKKPKKEKEISDELNEDYSSDETDFFDDVTPPPSNETLLSPYQNLEEKTKQLKVLKEIIHDEQCASSVPNGIHDSELDSEDTGRGSSLAFSDNGKFFLSPDHDSYDNPHLDTLQSKVNSDKYLDASTNTSYNIEHKATSPLMFDDVALLSDIGIQVNTDSGPRISSPEYFISDVPLSNEVVTIREKIKMVDCASSPIPELDIMNASFDPSKSNCKITVEDLMLDVSFSLGTEASEDKLKMIDCATSPIPGIERVHVSLSPVELNDNHKLIVDKTIANNINDMIEKTDNDTIVESINLPQTLPGDFSTNAAVEICKNKTLENICLEQNNSNSISSKSKDDDKEIEMIFSSMRLEHGLLTPIPHTPLKFKKSKYRKQLTMIQENCGNHKCCKNIISLEKKHLLLQKNYAAMEKVIKCMKSSLQALTVLPLKSIADEWINEGSSDMYSGNGPDKDEEELYRYTQSNLESKKSLSQIEELIEVNDENIPLSEVFNVKKTEVCAGNVTYDDVPTKSPDRNLNHCGTVSPDINHVRNVIPERNSPEKILSPVRNVPNNFTQDEEHHKSKSKHKKLSKLQRMRHKLLPKCKISENTNKPLCKKKAVVAIRKPETDKLLENKLAYEKAVKIMAEAKLKNNRVINIEKLGKFGSESIIEKCNYTSKLDLLDINTSKKDPYSEDILIKSNRRTRSQSQKSTETESVENVDNSKMFVNEENNVNMSISHSKELIKANECNTVRQKSECIELKLHNSVKNNRRNTRSQSKLSETESDTPLRPAVVQEQDNINDNICKGPTEGQNIENTEELNRITNTRNQSNDDSVDISSLKPVDNTKQKTIHTTNNTDNTCDSKQSTPGPRKRSRTLCDEIFEPIPKRVLRSYKAKESSIENMDTSSSDNNSINIENDKIVRNKCDTIVDEEIPLNRNQKVIDYNDINIFKTTNKDCAEKNNVKSSFTYPKNSILCKSIDKYGKKRIRFSTNKVTEQMSNSICSKLEEDIAHITQMPADKVNQGMTKLVEDMQKIPSKTFITGLMKYLRQPMRKQEMFKLVTTPPAPPMTKPEQILLFVIRQIKQDYSNIVESVLQNMEFSLFQLNKTPEFDIVESMSHFYAIVCRYFGLKHRLRLFLLDAMYCMSFKAVTVVKNCLDVWMHILPLAHMGIAKSPLVTCLVYLLHFYKCEDKFKKIDVIRNILHHKYFYNITEMTEAKMLEMFTNAVKTINDVLIEKKILRTSLIILAKRRGAVWCQKNIIKNMLLPIIETKKCSDISKQFAVSMLGPLVKPYPMDMKVHSEIILNQLMDMLDQNPSDSMKEAIFTSLIFMSRQNHFRVTQALLNWEPESVTQEFEGVIKDFVTEKPIKTWTKILPKMLFQQH